MTISNPCGNAWKRPCRIWRFCGLRETICGEAGTVTNEELAIQAQNGDMDALLTLWNQVRRLAWKFMGRWQWAAEHAGMEAADCEQVGFLALMKTVSYFDENSDVHFSTYFSRCVQNELATAAGTRTDRQQKEPLKYASSLDVPASPDAPEDLTLGELIPDPSAEAAFYHVEASVDLEQFLESLPMDQQAALYRRYWLDLPLDKAARKAHDAALKTLRHPKNSQRLRQLF